MKMKNVVGCALLAFPVMALAAECDPTAPLVALSCKITDRSGDPHLYEDYPIGSTEILKFASLTGECTYKQPGGKIYEFSTSERLYVVASYFPKLTDSYIHTDTVDRRNGTFTITLGDHDGTAFTIRGTCVPATEEDLKPKL